MGAVCVTEPHAGSDVAGLKTRAVKTATGWVLNGSKTFITNGVYGDIYIVAARTDSAALGSKGISLFIVDMKLPHDTLPDLLQLFFIDGGVGVREAVHLVGLDQVQPFLPAGGGADGGFGDSGFGHGVPREASGPAPQNTDLGQSPGTQPVLPKANPDGAGPAAR